MADRRNLEFVIRAKYAGRPQTNEAIRDIDRVSRRVQQEQVKARRQESELRKQIIDTRRMYIDVASGMALPMAAATAGLGFALKKTLNEGMPFQEWMRNVNSLAHLNEQAFQGLSESVLDLTRDRRVVDAPLVLARGLYDIQSSGWQGAEGLDILAVASKGAAAGLSDTATAADILTSIMNAYGQRTGAEANETMNTLFKIIDKGKVMLPDLAQQLGTVVAQASQAGSPLEEVGAAYALMTIQGFNAAESATALERAYSTLLRPPKELEKTFQRLFRMTPAYALQNLGLAKTVRMVDEATGGNAESLAQLGFEMRAWRAMLALTGEQAGKYAEYLAYMKDNTDALGAALAQQQQSAAFEVKHAKAEISAAAIEISRVYLPIVAKAANVTAALARGFSDLPDGAQDTIAYAGIAAAAIMGIVTAETLARLGIGKLRIAASEMAFMKGQLAGADTREAAANIRETKTIEQQTVAVKRETAAIEQQTVAIRKRSMLLPAGWSAHDEAVRQRMAPTVAAGQGRLDALHNQAWWENQMMSGRLPSQQPQQPGKGARAWAFMNRPIPGTPPMLGWKGMAGGMGDMAMMAGMATGSPGLTTAGMLGSLAPGAAAVLTNPVTWIAAAGAATFFLEKKAIMGHALDTLEASMASRDKQALDVVGKGGAYEYEGRRIDIGKATGYQPHDKGPWGFFGSDKRLAESLRDMKPADRAREMERIRRDNPELHNWLMWQMVGEQKLITPDQRAGEQAQGINRGRRQEQQQTGRNAAVEAEAQRQHPELWGMPEAPAPGTGLPQTPVQINVYANDREAIMQQIDRALPVN